MAWRMEDRFLLSCSKLSLDEDAIYACEIGLDWDYIFTKSLDEGLSGLVYKSLKQIAVEDRIPRDVLEDLKEEYYRSFGRNMVLHAATLEVLEAFEDEGIDCIVLPGVSLMDVYKDPGLRPMEDVDILVRKRDQSKARRTMRNLGYQDSGRYKDVFVKNATIFFDLHTDLMNASRIGARSFALGIKEEDIWSEALKRGDGKGAFLSKEDTILYLAAHVLKHSFNRKIWFVDIRRLLESWDINWRRLLTRARHFNLEKPLYCSLTYVKEIMDADIPKDVLEEMKHLKFNFLERAVLRSALENRNVDKLGDLLLLFNIEQRGQRFEFLKETYLPRPEVMAQVFPRASARSFFFAYLLRLLQLMREGLKGSTGFLRGLVGERRGWET